MTPEIKSDVYAAWTAGQSKASLAQEYDVSPRTIGRWIQEIQENPPVAKVVQDEVKPEEKAKDTRYLEAYYHFLSGVTKKELFDWYSISPSTLSRWLKRAEDEQVKVDTSESTTADSEVRYQYTASSKAISITKIEESGLTSTFSTDKTVVGFSENLDKLIEENFSQEALAEVFVSLQPTLALEKFTQGKLQIDPKAREIFYVVDEDTVPYKVNNSLSGRIIEMVRNGESGTETLLNFMEKLMENPSRRAVDELYGFLEANDIVIAEDGDFYAWKKVRDDYMDIYSNSMDNSPGTHPRVARNMVDEDSNRTCSYGLHVCSKSYLPKFGNNVDSRVVKVKVNPADVVAIPADYNNAKMRCCGYEVIEDVTNLF